MLYTVSSFFVEYILDVVINQNKQLLKEIAKDYELCYEDLLEFIPTHQDIIEYISTELPSETPAPR
jgi:hypothetical protein